MKAKFSIFFTTVTVALNVCASDDYYGSDDYYNRSIPMPSGAGTYNTPAGTAIVELHQNCISNRVSYVKQYPTYLLTKRNGSGWTPLHSACAYASIDVVSYLVESKVPLNALDKTGYTPLDMALAGIACTNTNASDLLKYQEIEAMLRTAGATASK